MLRIGHAMISVEFATPRVEEKIAERNLTLDECIEVLENDPYEIRSGTDAFGNAKYAAFGETYGGKFAMVVYVAIRRDLYRVLSARSSLTRHEIRAVRRRHR